MMVIALSDFDCHWFWCSNLELWYARAFRSSMSVSIFFILIIATSDIGSVKVARQQRRWPADEMTDPSISSTTKLCPAGTYGNPIDIAWITESGASLYCLPCSQCGPGLYVAHPCQRIRDTVCDSCHTYRGPHNEDFNRRCRADYVTHYPRPIDSMSNMTSANASTIYRVQVKQSAEYSNDKHSVLMSSDEYQWIHLAVNVLFVVLIALSCFVAFVVYHLKRSPINGYKVITKIEDV